ncbi:Intermediate filament protein, partial [Rhizoclosmatium hyalinum]
DKNPFIQGSNRRSTLTQGSDLIKSAAKGILQRVANGAETIKSFRPNLGRKKINSDAEAESSGYESCNDNALDRTWSESYETVLEEMEVSEDGPVVDSATLEKKGVTQADILLPALSTPRIIELDEVMENTKSELEDVQEHLANSAQLDLSASRIRALNLMKAGLEVELKRLETEKAACKDRDIQNLISPKSTSVIIRCDEDGRDLTHFTVEVHLTNAEGIQSGWIVHRKFSEFITLHQTLKSHFPAVNQYEAPQNKIFKGVLKFRKRFVENRRKLLEMYLQNLLKHVDICKSIEFRKFICHTDIIRLLYNDTVSTHDSKAENKKKKQFVKNLFHKFEENIKRHTKPQSRFNSVSLNAEEVAALKSRPENNTDTVDLLFDLITEIFELKEKGNFIRRKALNLVLQHILGGAIERRVTDSLKSVFCEEFMVSRIEYLKTSLFDTVWPIRTPEQKAKCRQTSSSKMIHLSLQNVARRRPRK